MLLSLMLSVALAAYPQGWRGSGDGHAEASPPKEWKTGWTLTEQAWSNASPVPFGELVCTNAEPTDLVCVRRSDGVVAWRVPHPVVDALTTADRPAAEALLTETEPMQVERRKLQVVVSELQRQARRSPEAEDIRSALEQSRERLQSITSRLSEARYLRTPDDQEIMGYTTSTPVTDGTTLWALYGNGVIAAHDAEGRILWQRWLGRSVGQMRGYDRGHAASPVLVDDTLLVPWGELHALNAKTGKPLWSDGRPWRDFGSPAATTIEGLPVALTPDGRLLRATDGHVLQEGLGDIFYIGPHIVGDRAFYLGGKSGDHTSRKGSVDAIAWRLTRSGDTVSATQLWTQRIETKEVFYSGPILIDERLYSVDKAGVVRVFDASDGSLLHTRDELERLRGWTYPSPVYAGGLLWIGSGKGTFVGLVPGRELKVKSSVDVGGDLRSTPLFHHDSVYVRRLDGLVRFSP